MPDAPTPQPTPLPIPPNTITIPIPSVGGLTDNMAFKQFLNAVLTIAILYAAAKFGVPVVPSIPAPTVPSQSEPAVQPTAVSQ